MTTSVYVILENTFSYNDETYQQEDGGRPTEYYTSEAKAEAAAHKANQKAILDIVKNGHLPEYGYYDLESIFDDVEEVAKLFGADVDDLVDCLYNIQADLEKKVAEHVTLTFFEVVEVRKG